MIKKTIIEKIISLANAASEERSSIRKAYNLDNNLPEENELYSIDDFFEMKKYTTPKRDEIQETLKGMNEDDIRDIVAIMYTGRANISIGDDTNFDTARETVNSWSKSICISKLMEKAPLARYLTEGLKHIPNYL